MACKIENSGRYVFVDFDGVLTSTRWTPGSYLTHMPENYGPSPIPYGFFGDFVKKNRLSIIISSNWRRFEKDGIWNYNGMPYINPISKFENDFKDNIVGRLPLVRHISKSQALDLWFEENNICPSDLNFVVFEDNPAEGFTEKPEYAAKTVMTDYIVGITAEDINTAERILENGRRSD